MEIILDHREAKLIEIFERDYPDFYKTAPLSIGDIHIIDSNTKQILLCINHYTGKLNVWSWKKLWSNREKGLGYK